MQSIEIMDVKHDAKQELVWKAITIAINMTIDILEIKEYIEELEK